MRPTQPLIAPSILSADFSQLGAEIARIDNADWIHVDIMDGHFVPNLSFGAVIAQATRASSSQHMNVHLMIDSPQRWVDDYIAAGADSIIFHVEAVSDHAALARYIRSQGVKVGFSLRPGTALEPYLDDLNLYDIVLVMSVEPGFGGQSFMPDQLDKVRMLRKRIDAEGLDTIVEIDGGISLDTIAAASEAGCDCFVAGSAVFTPKPNTQGEVEEPRVIVEKLRACAQEARA